VVLLLALSIAGAAAWFIFLQVVKIGAFCPWCMAAHWIGVFIAILVVLFAPISLRRRRSSGDAPAAPLPRKAEIGPAGLAAAIVVAASMLGVLAWGQARFRPPGHRLLTFEKAGAYPLRIESGYYPVIGSRSAPHMFLCFFDYTCPHCRALHRDRAAARARYPDQIAIALAPVPLDSRCNPGMTADEDEPIHAHACDYARLMLIVFRFAPDRLEAFDAWLMEGDRPPPVEAANRRVAGWIGAEKLAHELEQPWVSEMVSADIKVNHLIRGRGGLPTLLIAKDRVIAGRPNTAEDLFRVLEEELKLKPAK
jgi:hypothetical protein